MSAPAPQPLVFDAGDGWCHGWYHPPESPARGLTIVLCPPAGYEAICSYPTYVQLARALADAGYPVLRFDYRGTGDSAGDERDPGQVTGWLASIEAAVHEARRRSGNESVGLFGLRLGATLAVTAAARLGGVDALVLWAPCATGKSFTRELRATGAALADGALLAFGHVYTAETLQDLHALDATRPGGRPAPRALVIARDDLPGEGPLPGALRAADCDVDLDAWPGYAAAVGEPRAGVLQRATLSALQEWLGRLPAAAQRHAGEAPARDATLPARSTGAVREETWLLGPDRSLCAVFAEPAAGGDASRTATGVVLLNVGGNPRTGPHRFYVTAARAMAAAGYRAVRLDVAGLGDSVPHPGKPWASLYDRDSIADVRAAVDALAARGCREFVLLGICSGSFLSFQSALADPRVGGVVLLNSRLLEWAPADPQDNWHASMQQYAKSTDWYRRALLRPGTWLRLARGEVDVRLIAGRFVAVAKARLKRMLAAAAAAREGTPHGNMKQLCRRGTDVLMVASDSDDARDYMEFHFGPGGSRMRAHPSFRMVYVPDADHTFSRPGNQAFVIALLLEHLAAAPRRLRPDVASDDPLSPCAVSARPTP